MFFEDSYFKPFLFRDAYSAPRVVQINEPDHRFYQVSDDLRYPSVSTVVGQTSDKKFLEEWRSRVGEKEADRISKQATKRGTAVHLLCEKYLLGERDDFKKAFRSSMPDVQANWRGLKDSLDDNVDEVLASEIALYSNQWRMAGTTDLVAVWNGKRSIVDFKTSKKPKKLEWIEGYFVQCEAYAFMWEELYEEPIEQLVVLMAVDHQKEPMVFIEPRNKYDRELAKRRTLYYKMFGV